MTIYLCGGINALSDSQASDWRELAKSHLPEFTILDPMRRDYRGVESSNVAEIIRGDIADIDASDALIVNASRPSWGTAMEVFYAFNAGKVVISFGAGDKPSPWLVGHSSILCPDIETAIIELKKGKKR